MASGGEKRKGSLRYFGEKGQNASRTGTTFSFLLSEGVQKKKKKGLLSHDSLRLVVGGRKQRVFAENDRHGEAGEKGEQQFDERCVASLVVLLYVSFFFFFFSCGFFPSRRAASELLGTPGGRLLRGHAGPERGEVLRAAHVRSLERNGRVRQSPFPTPSLMRLLVSADYESVKTETQ